MDPARLLKTPPEKVLLPFNEVAKQLRVVGNYWEHFVSFGRKSRGRCASGRRKRLKMPKPRESRKKNGRGEAAVARLLY